MATRLLFLLLFTALIGNAQTFTPDLLKYTGLVFKQVAIGEIPVFDSSMHKLSATHLYSSYVAAQPSMADKLSNNFYTHHTFQQAAFINTFHYGLFAGLMGLPDLPAYLFDTLTYKPNPRYIVFRLYRYNDNGSFMDKIKLFIVDRNLPSVNKELVLKNAIKESKDSLNRNKVKLLTNTQDASWQIEEIWVNNKKVALDMCQSRYHLRLSANMQFRQYYTDTTNFDINRKAGVATGIERSFYYPHGAEHTQCYLENEQGIWTFNKSKLTLLTTTGIVLATYKLHTINKEHMQLQIKNYKLLLIKR